MMNNINFFFMKKFLFLIENLFAIILIVEKMFKVNDLYYILSTKS
jgi:hypothetical protein